MALEEIKVKITADKTQVDGAFNDIKGTANKVEAESKKAATSIGSVISAVVGAAAVQQITSFFSSAIGKYNQLNAALMRVESTSKAVGQSIERNKKLVQELADQGFMTLTESANAFSDSISMGLDPTKAKKFVESLSDIAAVERTMGTLNEAVSSGISGLRSGSSERVENIGVSVKKLSQEYQINTQKLGQAAAMEKFYQGVIKESTKYRGEALKSVDSLAGAQTKYNAAVEKAQAAIGKGLEPVMKRLYAVGTQLADMFTKWFDGLKDSQKLIVLLGGAAVALVPAIAAVGGALGTLALNPVTLAIMAVVAAATALTFVLVGMEREISKGVGLVDEQKKLKNLVEELKKTKAGSEELAEAQRKLDQVTKTLNESFGETLKILRAENAEYEKKVELVARLEAAEKNLGGKDRVRGLSDEELAAEIAKFKARAGGETSGVNIGGRVVGGSDAFSRASAAATGSTVGGVSFGGDGELMVADATASAGFNLAVLEAERARRAKGGKKGAPAAATGAKRSEVRFLESRKALEEIAANEKYTIDRAKATSTGEEQNRRIAMAKENAKILAETEVGQLRQVYAEFIEDKYQADLEGLKRQENEAIASVRRQVEAGKLDKEKAEQQIQKIREKGIQKEAALSARSMAETMQAANATASGLAQIRGGNVGGGIGATLQGISGFNKDNTILQTIGSTGVMLGAASTIAATLGSIFGESEAERAQAAEKQRQIAEEQLIYLKLQENHQKNQLALMEAAAKTPFETLSRNLRLADIQAQQARLAGGDEGQIEAARLAAQRQAVTETLSAESGKISEGSLFGGVTGSADSLIGFLNERGAQQTAIAQFVGLAETIQSDATPNGDSAKYSAFLGRLALYRAQVLSYRGKVPDQMIAPLLSWIDSISDMNGPAEFIGGLGPGGSMRYRTQAGREYYGVQKSSIINSILQDTSALGAIRGLSSEVTQDTGRAESLLSEIERLNQIDLQIATNTKKTADNTTKLAEGKGDAIVDIAAGGLSQNGAFLQGGLLKYLMGKSTIDPSSLVLNPSIQNAILSSQVMESLDERMARGVDQLVSLNEREVDLLSIIAANLQSNPNPARDELRQQILDILEEFRSRS